MPKGDTWLVYSCVSACILNSGLSPEKNALAHRSQGPRCGPKGTRWLKDMPSFVIFLKETAAQNDVSLCREMNGDALLLENWK